MSWKPEADEIRQRYQWAEELGGADAVAKHHARGRLSVPLARQATLLVGLGGTVKEVLDLEPLAAKWGAFGWTAVEIDGHDLAEIEIVLSRVPLEPGRPTCVVAHTVKGKGVDFMEDRLLWHYRSPSDEDLGRALAGLGDNE